MEMEKRKVSDSIVETVHMVRPQHLNASDRLFGGALMQWIDEVAGMVAKRHTRRNVITASVDSLSFLRGAYVKDTVVIIGSKGRYLCRGIERGTYADQSCVFYNGGTGQE